jgi:predicted membrane-bound spermidine synthase
MMNAESRRVHRVSDAARSEPALPIWVPLAFFFSGFAALIYQVVWQRALYGIFGITIESVTVVVTAFLLGLGLGSLVGGAVSERPGRALMLFALAELSIACFGAVSLSLFRWVGTLLLRSPLATTSVATVALLLIPTLLMGMTLPLLTAHAVSISRNVGQSVSLLYFVNTAGSAIAAMASVAVFLPLLGMRRSVLVAVAVNVLVGTMVLLADRVSHR